MPPILRSHVLALSKRSLAAAALFSALAMASPSLSEETKQAWFTTPGHAGALVLEIPKGWSHRSLSLGGRPTDVRIKTGGPDGGPDINFTLMWNVGNAPDYNTPDQLKTMFATASAPFATHNVNSDLDVQELSGSQVAGLYTALQNPDLEGVGALAEDEYRVLTPGIFSIGELQVFFSLISKEEDSSNRMLALQMFRGARFEADASTRTDRGISVPVTVEGELSSASPKPKDHAHGDEGHSH